MLLLYNAGVTLYYLAIYIASFFNSKARLWIYGRKAAITPINSKSIWFHFASLGEFEQGRPVLEQMRQLHPAAKIVITFFSPSGYEVRKNTPLADYIYYLPLDTAKNARQFIAAINPAVAIFTKYEYWYHYFNELNKREVSLYIISGIFRPGQVFFKWYGGLHRKMLIYVTRFFVQDEQSKLLLQNIGINSVTISGDTRFDRVWANAQQPKQLPDIEQFANKQKTFIAGSTWPEDEKLVAQLVKDHPDWKFIFAPHEINKGKINALINLLPENSAVRHSQLTTHNSQLQTLVVDNIGMLSSLYQYGHIAYIGGGFGAGIHNTLEAAAFGLPVVFGPNYYKFKEAKDIIAIKAGFSIANETELKEAVATLINDEQFYNYASRQIKEYVQHRVGATAKIIDFIQSNHKY
ncbi:MAG: 3-deoxy-D-manno-octulosonic acid transferase [Sphingobacteriaceae bacterium]|nr:MAG: 3-deoxy-D-manno-octulosonic acid transferase [Sphingobacteriaceae bacterium]